ncbi:uncharacterized protein [Pocillopora verrucosa]|uniref:uncharacterized protein n=1 Tax=Pocillopora verrucosa TaxID=203993 RepID=UPI003342CF4E
MTSYGRGSIVVIRSQTKARNCQNCTSHSEHVEGHKPQYYRKFAVSFSIDISFVYSICSFPKSRYFNHNLWGSTRKSKRRRGKGAQETEERKTKKKNTRVQDHRGLFVNSMDLRHLHQGGDQSLATNVHRASSKNQSDRPLEDDDQDHQKKTTTTREQEVKRRAKGEKP